MTPGTFNTPRHTQKGLRACRFRFGYLHETVNLATQINSLAHSSKRTIQRCTAMLVLTPRDVFLHIAEPFTPYLTITNWFQALCTSLLGVLFSFRSPYYYAIGLKTCLVLEVDVSQLPVRIPTHGTQEQRQIP